MGPEEPSGARSRRWPNLFVVGVPKAGTTTLYTHLRGHPQIFMTEQKEPHFFSRDDPPSPLDPFVHRVRDQEAYLRLYENAREPVVGEASTSYFAHAEAPHRIAEVAPDAKVIVILRDPVQRAYSHYLTHVSDGLEKRSFLTAVGEGLGERPRASDSPGFHYVAGGFYADRVLVHRRLFGTRFRVAFYEELFQDLPRGLSELYEFLAVDTGHTTSIDSQVRANAHAVPARGVSRALLGSARARRAATAVLPRSARSRVRRAVFRDRPKPQMPAEAATMLSGAYTEDRQRLEEILKRPMPW